jgi:hypothetical protein
METLKWNLGILLINLAYKVRFYQQKPKYFKLRYIIGVLMLRIGYKLRGQIPKKTWKYFHI